MTKNVLEVYGIKTNKGYLLSTNSIDGFRYRSILDKFFINGKKPRETFHNSWVISDSKPEIIEELKSQPSINHRYELIDKSLASEKFPLVFKREDVAYYDNEEYEWYWNEEVAHLRSLYELKYDKQEPKMEKVEFTYEEIGEVDELISPEGFSYSVLKDSNWGGEETKELTEKDVQHQLLDKILFPSVLLNNKPCKLTSKQMFEVVRQYIKQHINYDVATISSDYSFCFQVNKLIKISEPYTVKKEIMKSNGRPYKKPRYNSRYVTNRSVKVFEMTHFDDNYKGYTPIPEMIGENIQDLKEKVDRYCKELIEEINKPLVDCPHCKGHGVLIEK